MCSLVISPFFFCTFFSRISRQKGEKKNTSKFVYRTHVRSAYAYLQFKIIAQNENVHQITDTEEKKKVTPEK